MKIIWRMRPLQYSITFKLGRQWYEVEATDTLWSLTGGHKPTGILIRKMRKPYTHTIEPSPIHPLRVIMEKHHSIVNDPLAWSERSCLMFLKILKNDVKVIQAG